MEADDPLSRRYVYLICAICCSLLFSCDSKQSRTQENESDSITLFEHFYADAVQEVTISTSLLRLQHNKHLEEYQPAIMEWQSADGEFFSHHMQVSPRGNNRREVCDFPPLKLKFQNKDLEKRGLKKLSSLKLVSHCDISDPIALKELLVYKLYNELTNNSYRVQLLKIKYIDTAGQEETIESYGFIIEPTKELSRRLDATVLSAKEQQNIRMVDGDSYRLFTMFQYMIGNTDWALNNRHNIKLLNTTNNEAPILIPYDFDYAGMVAASYAKPYPTLPIESVKERLLQWRGKDAQKLLETIDFFKSKKRDLLDICQQFEYLSEQDRNSIVEYLNSFFQIIEDEGLLKRELAKAGISSMIFS